jgi:hypothetical protein
VDREEAAGNRNSATIAIELRTPMPGKAAKSGGLAGVMLIVILEI